MNDLFTEETPQVEDNKDYYAELVGDDRKYKTKEDLAKSRFAADLHIKNVERENAEMRTEISKLLDERRSSETMEQLLDKWDKRQRENPNSTTPANGNNSTTSPQVDLNQILNQLKPLISSEYSEIKNRERQQENYNMVKAKLTERYGTNYQPTLKKQIDDLGLSEQDVQSMAMSQPKVLIRALGLDRLPQAETFQTPPRGNQRLTDPFKPTGEKKRTWSYYQDLKKTNPKLYYDSKIANQMYQDHMALGKDFEDGDFGIYGDASV